MNSALFYAVAAPQHRRPANKGHNTAASEGKQKREQLINKSEAGKKSASEH
jgi:hypothetical protein